MKSTGWTRITVVASLFWALAIAALISYEYTELAAGDEPGRFTVLRDSKTGDTYGRLKMSEVRRLGELTELKSQSVTADPGDAAEARKLMEAVVTPSINWSRVLAWCLLPIAAIWLVYGSVRWVIGGFSSKLKP